MNDILYSKKGNLTVAEKKKLQNAGKVIVEVSDLANIKHESYYAYQPLKYINCCSCGERIYVLEEREKALRSGGASFYCSYGHSQSFSKSK